MTTEHGADPPSLAGADPSLSDGAADGPFPDTAVGTRVVLYQTEDGAVDLRWYIDPADVAHARAAFGGAPAQPVLRLHRSGDDGADQVIANAKLDDDAAAQRGLAHYAGTGGEGLLRAEIGLVGDGGGWMLIARSNGLPAATAVGAELLREDAAAPRAPAADSEAAAAPGGDAEPAADLPGEAASDAVGEAADRPASRLSMAIEFPLVEPVLSLLAEITARGGSVALDDGTDPGTPPRLPSALRTAFDADDAGSAGAVRSGVSGLPPGILRALEEPPPGGVVPRLQPQPETAPPAGEPPAGAVAAALRLVAGPVAGSGPLRRPDDDASLRAELVVHGSAPPGTVLDLGGHAYHVGPGGRFVLRIPIREAGLVQRVLGALPQLPVVPRPDRDA